MFFDPGKGKGPRLRSAFLLALTALLGIGLVAVGGCGGGSDRSADDSREQLVPDPAVESEETGGETDLPAAADSVIPVDNVAPPVAATANAVPAAAPTVPPASQPASPPAPSPPPKVAAPAAAGYGPYCLQVGSFRQRERAERRLTELAPAGLHLKIVEATVSGQRYWRVYVPNLETRSDATRLGERLKERFGFDYLVRKE